MQAYYCHAEPTMNASVDALVVVENAFFESNGTEKIGEKIY